MGDWSWAFVNVGLPVAQRDACQRSFVNLAFVRGIGGTDTDGSEEKRPLPSSLISRMLGATLCRGRSPLVLTCIKDNQHQWLAQFDQRSEKCLRISIEMHFYQTPNAMNNVSQVFELFRRKVLHVDSYQPNMELVQRIIERRPDLQLITARTGSECVQMACAHLPAVILLEPMLPGMNLNEVLKKLRVTDATKDIRVIALSSDAMPAKIEAAMDAGVFSYLTKPFKINDLLQAIDAALQYPVQSSEASVITI